MYGLVRGAKRRPVIRHVGNISHFLCEIPEGIESLFSCSSGGQVKDLENGREQTYTPLCAEGNITEDVTFQSYHYQALKSFSEKALLAGFLMF